MANGGQSTAAVTSYAIPSAAYSSAGIMSATTNTLTPTTLGNLEQTFIELQSVPTTSTVQNPMTQSGFVPPVVTLASDPENSYGYGSDSNSSQSGDDYLPSHPKKIRIGDKTTTIMSKFEIENPQRKTHRRQIREEEVTAEEAARRSLRRERNKIAAAKCRQRRVDHTNRLLTETEKLEQEQQAIEAEIQALQNEKDQLEFILQAHSQLCKVSNGRVAGVKLDFNKKDTVEVQIKRDPDALERNRAVTKAETAVTSRPSSLSLSKRDLKDVSGIAITTPSSGFLSFSLDTMVDHTGLTPLTGHLGHTGLTPVTSLPVSCGSEVTKKQSTSSESSDGVKSPPSGLISL